MFKRKIHPRIFISLWFYLSFEGYDGMVFCLVLFNGKSYLFYVSRFYEKGHTAG